VSGASALFYLAARLLRKYTKALDVPGR